MSQNVLLEKINKFLELTSPEMQAELGKYLKRGHCFGFAIVFAALSKIGMREWWKAMLFAIAQWDGDPNKLDEPMTLPQMKSPITLRQIITKVMNFVIPHQLAGPTKFFLNSLTQTNLLMAEEEYFEIFDNSGRRYIIAGNNRVAGTIAKADLNNLLNEQHIGNGICLFHNDNHVISIAYENNTWIVYDPNYSHQSLNTMQTEFSNKNDMVTEVVKLQGIIICIEVAWFKHKQGNIEVEETRECFNPFNHYINKLTACDIAGLLAGHGLSMIATYCPEFLSTIFKKAATSTLVRDSLFQGLFQIDRMGWSGLLTIFNFVPEYLKDLFLMAGQCPQFAQKILSILPVKMENGNSNLHGIVVTGDPCFSKMFFAICDLPATPDILAKLCQEQDDPDEEPFFQKLLSSYPSMLFDVLSCASKSTYFPEILASLAVSKNSRGKTLFQQMLETSILTLPLIIQQFSLVTNKRHLFTKIFLTTDNNFPPGIHFIRANAPQYLAITLDLVSKTCNVIEAKDYGSMIIILENAPDSQCQKCFLNNLLKQTQTPTLDIIPLLPNNFAKKRELAAAVIVAMIERAQSSMQLKNLITSISTDSSFIFLTKRIHVNSIFNKQPHSKQQQFSEVWINLLETVAERMLALLGTPVNFTEVEKEFFTKELRQPIADYSRRSPSF